MVCGWACFARAQPSGTVQRWIREANGALSVDVVDLHPALLVMDWANYAKFVLFHEYLHVLGHRAHDSVFRTLERSWPDREASQRGKAFTHARRLARAKWHWVCPSCDQRFPRQRRGGGDTSAGRAGPHWWTCPCMTSNEIPHRFGLINDGARQATVSMSCLDVVFGRPCFSSGLCSGVGWFDPRRRRGVLVVQSGQRLCFDTDAGR